ncbi:MAG: hypothetical protein MZW92_17750 [Comamonadaceae bacterium]|nr:hypothetical protein [Comamonadaceae bacterium]
MRRRQPATPRPASTSQGGQEYLIQGIGRVRAPGGHRRGGRRAARRAAGAGAPGGGGRHRRGAAARHRLATTASRRWCSASRSSRAPTRWS